MKTFLHKSHFLSIIFLLANLFFASVAFGQATVSTDLLDYRPGSTAIITGSGFQAGETVILLVEHVGEEPAGTDPQYHQPWTVLADSIGNIQTSWYVPTVEEGDALGATFLLTADSQSGAHAQWTFTDATNANDGDGTITVLTVPNSKCSGSTGNSLTFTFTAPNGKNFNAVSELTLLLPIGWTTPQNTTFTNPGFISLSGTASAKSISSISGSLITITMTCSAGSTVIITYEGGGTKVTVPTVGTNTIYTFTTQTKQNGGTLTNIASQPIVTLNANNNAGAASSTPTLCINTTLTGITHVTTGATGIGSPTGLPTGVTAVFASNTITISGTPTASGTFNYTIPLSGGCGSVNATGTITVTPNNTVSAASSTATSCINIALTNITHTTTGATGLGSATGLPAGVSAAWASNTITISGTPTASGIFNYTISLTGGCGSINATGTITVKANNTVGAASSTPTLCINTVLTNITHTTTGATGIGSPTGLPAGVAAVFASNAITISGTPTASGTFNYTIPITGSCSSVNATGTITVKANNTVAAASLTPTLCINTILTDITHTTTGAIGIGSPTGLPAGVTAAFASNTITIGGTPTASGTFNYSIPLTGGCSSANATGTITVTPNNSVGAASSTPTVCINTVLTNITHATTGATGIGSATGLPAGVTAAFAFNAITISGTPTASGIFNYTISLTGGCGGINATGTITVKANNTVGAASSTPTLCINSLLTNITHTTTGATGIGSPTGLPAGVAAAFTSNTITISGTPTASGIFNYSLPLTGGCSSVNATGTITIRPVPAATTTPSTQTVCSGDAIIAIVTNSNVSGTTYAWTSSVTGNVDIVPSSGSGDINSVITNNTTAIKTVTFTITPTANGCIGTAITANVVVNPTPDAVATPTIQAICSGNVITAIVLSGSVGGTIFNWTRDNSSNITGISSSGTGNISGILSNTTTTAQSTIFTIIPTIGGCPGPPITAIVTVNKEPSFTICPLNILKNTDPDVCNAVVTYTSTATGTPTATLTYVFSGATTGSGIGTGSGLTFNKGVTTVTITATNSCGTASCSFTVTVLDITAPVLAGVPVDAAASCNTIPVAAIVTASDICDASPSIALVETSTQTPTGIGHYNYTLTRTWTATDVASNNSSKIQVISFQDTTKPVLSTSPADATVECDAVPAAATLTATDNCDAAPVVTYAEVRTNGASANNYTLTRTWTATDVASNSSSKIQVITVQDTTKPVLSTSPADATVECDAVPAAATLTATDNCDAAPVVTYAEVRTNGASANNYTLTRTWTATDVASNNSSKIQMITVRDTTKPILSTVPADTTVECDAVPAAATLTATDNCDAAPVVTYAEVRTNGASANNYTLTRTWTATDVASNSSSKIQLIKVQDTTKPILSTAPADATVECDAVPAAATLTATDNCDAAPVVTYAEVRTNGASANNYTLTRTWTATDVASNSSSKNQVITVQDTTKPVLSTAPADATVECNAVPAAATLTATDNCDAAPVVTYAEVRTNGASANNYTLTRTWTATDVASNSSSKIQVITVQDTTKPVLSVAPADATIECDAVPAAATLTATDNCDAAPVVTYAEVRTNGASANNYTLTRTWTATDVASNSSSKIQVITVQDTTKPVLAGVPTNTTANCATIPAAAKPIASDNCDANPVVTLVQTSTQTIAGVGHYNYAITRIWTATDVAGNHSSGTQVITVSDTAAPVLAGVPADVTASCNTIPVVTTPIASDICDASPVIAMVETSTQTSTGVGHYNYAITRVWTATDVTGNRSSGAQVITVRDTEAPVLAGVPADVTASCNTIPVVTTPIASDICDASPVIALVGTSTQTSTGVGHYNYTITRVWTATDAVGNYSIGNQVITVKDVTAPVITKCAPSVTVSPNSAGCKSILIDYRYAVVANDNCSSVTLTQTPVAGANLPLGMNTITITAKDESGNSTTCNFVVTVATSLALTVTNSNPQLYYGYSLDQSSIITGIPTGGLAPYTVIITMNKLDMSSRPLSCNVVSSSGDESWIPNLGANSATALSSSINYTCPTSGSQTAAPISTAKNVPAGGSYSVTATLMADAKFTVTVIDANGCSISKTTCVYSEDDRCFAGSSGNAKVKICHRTGNSNDPCHELCVDQSAVAAHLAHGDYIGSCLPLCAIPTIHTKVVKIDKKSDEIAAFDVTVYPNPTDHQFNLIIKGGNDEKVEVLLYDALGRMVKHIDNSDGQQIKFGEGLPTGIYIAIVSQGSNQKTIRLIKE